jgi:Protein of unknown function (DUF3710)
VGIFRRGTKDTRVQTNPVIIATGGEDRGDTAESDEPGQPDADLTDHDAESPTTVASDPALSRRLGPFDRSEVDGLEGRLDLGALWLTGIPGMELRLEVEEESQDLVGVTAVLGESAVQLQAFAAPRSEGIWDDIRTEIAASITSSGGTADQTSGPLGTELQAQMPGQGPEGRTVFSPLRFVGVDGPRWFLRAVLSGAAASDQDAASALLDVVRSTVVVRGDEAMAPRELLPLKLPEQPDPAGQDIADENMADEDAPRGAPSLNDLNPFERGPEITEIH